MVHCPSRAPTRSWSLLPQPGHLPPAPAARLPRTGANPGTRAGKTRSGRTAGSESAGACGGLARRVRPLPAELAVRSRGPSGAGPHLGLRGGLARSWELSADRRPGLWAAGRQCAGQPAAGGHGGGSGGAGGDAALAGGAARQYPGPRGHGECRGPAVREEGEAPWRRLRGGRDPDRPQGGPGFRARTWGSHAWARGTCPVRWSDRGGPGSFLLA